jgi:hypothetical protein
MGRFTHASLAAAGFIGLAGLAAPAFADPMLYVDNVATNPPLGNSVDSNVTLQGTVDGTSVGPEPEFAVEVVLTVNPGTSANPSTEYTLPTWCVDIFHDIFVPSSGETYSVGSLTTDNSLNPTALTSTQIQEIGDLVNYGDNLMQTSPSALVAAEVQSAIWTVEYNGGINGTNQLTVSSTSNAFSTLDITNTIHAAESYGGTAGQLISLAGVQGQAFATPAPPIGSGLPGVLAVGGLLFGARLFERSRKSRLPGAAAPHAAG